MVTEPALGADNLLFRSHAHPLFCNPADLPRDKDNTRKYHQNRDPLPRIRQGNDVAKANSGQRDNRKIKRVAKILHIRVQVALHKVKEPWRNEKYHQYGE